MIIVPQRTDWAVAVISAPREPETLPATLRSIARAGWPQAVVFRDGERRGPMANWERALQCLATTTANRFLICEDDIEMTPGLRMWLESSWQPMDGVVSLYCPSHLHTEVESRIAISPEKLKTGNGALAFAFRATEAASMLSVLRLYGTSRFPGPDHFVSHFCREFYHPYFVHSPSFVRHTGHTTSLTRPCGDERFRQCRSYFERINSDGSFKVVEGTVSSVDGISAGDGLQG